MPQTHEIDDSSTLSLVSGYQQMFIFRYIYFFFCVFLGNGDADPSREHLIAYGALFRLQTPENLGKPRETGIRADPTKSSLGAQGSIF